MLCVNIILQNPFLSEETYFGFGGHGPSVSWTSLGKGSRVKDFWSFTKAFGWKLPAGEDHISPRAGRGCSENSPARLL